VEDSSESCAQKMAFLPIEAWVCVYISIEIAGEDVLDLACALDMMRAGVWQLDPIVQQIVSNPEDSLVDTLTTGFS